MKHRITTWTAALAALLLAGSLMLSCSGGKDTADATDSVPADTTEAVTTAPVTTEEVTTEVVTETETQTETETEAVTEPPEPAFAPIVSDNGKDMPEIAPTADGVFLDPLTGISCEQAEAERRPVAIMLNNIKQALPQQQIAMADVLYECQVEGGLTRLLGIYNDWSALKAIGSVRSSREYYIDFAANHDAIYVHAGGSEAAYVNLKQRKINNLDAVNDGVAGQFFYRDPERRKTMGYEHTLVIDGDKLDAAIAAKKYRTAYAQSFASPLHFVGEEQRIDLVNGTAATEITVKFGAHTAAFAYDAATNKYLRSQNGNPHVEGTTGEQLAFENVITLFCPYTFTNDSLNHIEVDDVGSGKGYYFTGGKYVSINWSKASGDAAFKLTYDSGRELYLTPGKTNIEIVSYSGNVTIS